MGFWEAAMLICFGASWPASIWKTFRVKNPVSKSLIFLWLVLIGYGCGVANKFARGNPVWVLGLYVLNAGLVALDLGLVIYYRRRLRKHVESVD